MVQVSASGRDVTADHPKIATWIKRVREELSPHFDEVFTVINRVRDMSLKQQKSKLWKQKLKGHWWIHGRGVQKQSAESPTIFEGIWWLKNMIWKFFMIRNFHKIHCKSVIYLQWGTEYFKKFLFRSNYSPKNCPVLHGTAICCGGSFQYSNTFVLQNATNLCGILWNFVF